MLKPFTRLFVVYRFVLVLVRPAEVEKVVANTEYISYNVIWYDMIGPLCDHACLVVFADCCCTRFVNRDDIDFGLAQDLPAVQTLEMVRDSGGVEVSHVCVLRPYICIEYSFSLFVC